MSGAGAGGLAVSVMVSAGEWATLEPPVPGLCGPAVTLPGGGRVSVDAGAPDSAAAAFWRMLAVVSVYAAACCQPPPA